MSIRDERQREFSEVFLNSRRKGVLYLSPRFGKCRVGFFILEALDNPKVLISYPDNKIKHSWKKEFAFLKYDDSNITYTTHLSAHKYIGQKFDLIITDECHLISERQMLAYQELFKTNKQVLGLTGTLSSETENRLKYGLDLPVIARYSIEEAIAENVISDYEISVIRIPLDNLLKIYKGKTEKQKFDEYSYIIDKLAKEGKDSMFLRLSRMRLIQNSVAKIKETKRILKENQDMRILVFCGVTKIADSLGIPSYHSLSKEKKIFENFANGIGNHLAVCRIGNTGVTYKPLSQVIINYFDSNPQNLVQKIMRALSFEYDNKEKKAKIFIITSIEIAELQWLNKALIMFNKDKIIYV